MHTNSINSINFQANLVLSKNMRPKNAIELLKMVESFKFATPYIKGTFYVEKDISQNAGNRLNIYYKDGNYFDSCKYSEEIAFREGTIQKNEPECIKYSFFTDLFQQRRDMLEGFGWHKTIESFNKGMKLFAKHYGVEFEDLGTKSADTKIYPNFEKMEQEQKNIIDSLV